MPPAVPVTFETPQHRLTVHLHPRELEAYTLTEQELDALAAGNASTHLAIACAGLGIVVTLGATLATVPLDPKAFGAAIGALIGSGAATIGFGAAWWRDRGHAQRLVERIKRQRRRQ